MIFYFVALVFVKGTLQRSYTPIYICLPLQPNCANTSKGRVAALNKKSFKEFPFRKPRILTCLKRRRLQLFGGWCSREDGNLSHYSRLYVRNTCCDMNARPHGIRVGFSTKALTFTSFFCCLISEKVTLGVYKISLRPLLILWFRSFNTTDRKKKKRMDSERFSFKKYDCLYLEKCPGRTFLRVLWDLCKSV